MADKYEQTVRQYLSRYRHQDLACRDVMNVFELYQELTPKLDVFVFNTGEKKELFCLDGTIPVRYKGNVYNIPICLWILDSHPYNPPICYVKPTSDMLIKPSQNVDANGRIYLPYLHEWKHPQSDLVSLIQVMIIVFGENSPVYSKAAVAPPSLQNNSSIPNQGPQMILPFPSSTLSVTGGFPKMPLPTTGGDTSVYNINTFQPHQPTGGNYATYPSKDTTNSYPANITNSNPYSSHANSSNQIGTDYSTIQKQNSLSDDQIKASLVSAVQDKLKRRMKETFAQAQAEMDVLQSTHDCLVKGQKKLENMIKLLDAEQTDVQSKVEIIINKNEELNHILFQISNQENHDIDDAIFATTPLYKQIFNSYTEESALEDTIYYLGESLRKGIIGVDEFLKHVRDLSRRQFMLRAVIYKARDKAGLKNKSN